MGFLAKFLPPSSLCSSFDDTTCEFTEQTLRANLCDCPLTPLTAMDGSGKLETYVANRANIARNRSRLLEDSITNHFADGVVFRPSKHNLKRRGVDQH